MEPDVTVQPALPEQREPGPAGPEPALAAELENRLDALISERLDAAGDRLRRAERDILAARFAEAHPDFRELLAYGAIDAEKRANPMLDDMGAYYASLLAAERARRDRLLEEARTAAAEAESLARERFRTKSLARTLGPSSAGAGRGGGSDPELSAPEKFGGLHAVLAARLAERRKTADI